MVSFPAEVISIQAALVTVGYIVVSPAQVSLLPGNTATLTAKIYDGEGGLTTKYPWWRSTATSVAKVSSSGKVTAVAAGTARIIGAYGTLADTTVVAVTSTLNVASVVATPAADTLNAIGATAQLTAAARNASGTLLTGVAMSWASLNTGIATVDASGRVTAKSLGTARIVVQASCCLAADTVTVLVRQLVSSIVLQPATASIGIGASVQLTATAKDVNGYAIANTVFAWSSAAPAVATVDATGKVAGVSGGSAAIKASAAGKSATASVTVGSLATPPPGPLPQGVFFHDGFETGDFSHHENTMFWSSGTSVSNTTTFTGNYAGRSRHTASRPGTDITDAPSELRFRIAPINYSPYTAVWLEYYLYIPANHWHADKSTRGKQTWKGLALQAGTTTITGPAGSFAPNQKGMPIAIPGAGLSGDDGIVAFIFDVISDRQVEITGIHRYTRKAGVMVVTDAKHYVSQGAVATIPTSVANASATKIRSSSNHKHFVLWGRNYASLQQPHTFILAELMPEKNTDPTFGDSYLEVRFYQNGYVTPGTTNGLSVAGMGPGVRASGPGLKRGQWNRVRIHADAGSGPGIADGVIQVWYGNDLIINRTNLLMYANPVAGELNTPYPWFDAGYINGWVNGGFMEDTDYFVDNFALYVSDPGW